MKTLGGLLLLFVCPMSCPMLTYASTKGITLETLFHRLLQNSGRVWVDFVRESTPTVATWRTLSVFWLVIAVLYWMPGPIRSGTITPTGHEPKYTDNGLTHLCVFTLLFWCGGVDDFFPLSILYDELHRCVVVLNGAALVFCIYLYIKGRTHPSTPDVTYSGRGVLYDFFAGIELYPRVLGYDVKKIVNCRFSMTYWMVFGISCVYASQRIHTAWDWGLVWGAALTFVYLVKFFAWEIGYMRSIDIIEDNAGFMETWGCLVFVPAFYTNHLHYAVRHPSGWSANAATALGVFGLLCIALNYWTDRQRQVFRETQGRSMLWWPVPPKALRVDYTVVHPDGRTSVRESLLLINGFWGVVRHPQYIFEIGVAFTWGLLGNPWVNGVQPLFYPIFLTVLLTHRAHRDTERCREKYGPGWTTYMANVPYSIVPGVY